MRFVEDLDDDITCFYNIRRFRLGVQKKTQKAAGAAGKTEYQMNRTPVISEEMAGVFAWVGIARSGRRMGRLHAVMVVTIPSGGAPNFCEKALCDAEFYRITASILGFDDLGGNH